MIQEEFARQFGFSINTIHSSRAAGVNNNDNSQTAMYIALPYTPTWLDIRQRADGSWLNETDRWMEGDPNLVTGYALMALSHCRGKK